MKYLITYWLPPVALMLLIFYFSSLPASRIQITPDYWSEFTIKKVIHILEYGLLWLTLYRAFRQNQSNPVFKSFIITILFAISDEYHQTYTFGRTGTPRDIFFDILGATLAYIMVTFHYFPQPINKLLRALDIL